MTDKNKKILFIAIPVAVVVIVALIVGAIVLLGGANDTYRIVKVYRIDGSALPLGVERVASPSVVTVDVKAGDLIVLNSDGVSDVLTLPAMQGSNPQGVAERILEHALCADGGIAHDDMTTLVLRAV